MKKFCKTTVGVLIVLMFLLINCADKPEICIPREFTNNLDVCIGRNIDKLDFINEFERSNSSNAYFLHDENYDFFRTIYIEPTFLGNDVKSIRLTNSFLDYNPKSDSLAKEIIEICTTYYGSEYKIIDGVGSFLLKIPDRPVIIWEIEDKGYVALSYCPLRLIKDKDFEDAQFYYIFNLEISRNLKDKYKNQDESEVFTKESLGLE